MNVLSVILYEIIKPYDFYLFGRLRYKIIKNAIKSKHHRGYIGPNVIIKNVKNLTIGDDVSIHANCYLDASGKIEIGDNVSIAHNSSILSFDHTYTEQLIPIKRNELSFSPVVIHNDVWIGCGVRVLKGSVIETRTIIAANSVVKGSFPARTLLAGAPVKIKKSI